MIGLINAKSGNIGSHINALNYLKQKFILIENKNQAKNLNKLILPGVGAFKQLKKNLINLDLYDFLIDHINNQKNFFLGICVGMQILLSKGTEEGKEDGLNYFKGTVINFNEIKKSKTPNINWNNIDIKIKDDLFQNLSNKEFYFLHSYLCNIEEKKNIIATANYNGINFPCVIKKNNVYGIQFHPEKSNIQGLEILKNFCNLT